MMDGFGHMGFGWIFWFVLLVIGACFLINYVNKNKHGNENSRSESALEILKKRYARGEITAEQFEEMKKKLEN